MPSPTFPGVKVGHATLNRGDKIRTGVTAILPHGGNFFEKRSLARFYRQRLRQAGRIDASQRTGRNRDAHLAHLHAEHVQRRRRLIDYMLALDGNAQVRSMNPLVGETNDGVLNDIQGRHSGHDEVFAAFRAPNPARFDEGCGRRRHRDHRVWMERRHRNLVAQSWRVHGRRSGAIELRRTPDHLGVPIERPRTVAARCGRRLHHDDRRHRRACRSTQSAPHGRPHNDGAGPHAARPDRTAAATTPSRSPHRTKPELLSNDACPLYFPP